MLGEQKKFLKEGGICTIRFLEGAPLTAELPFIIDFLISEAEPGVRGDSASNIMKYAVIETGARVQVPLFIKEGDTIKIDTRTGKYLERVSRR
jgi:elongation factor P